MHPRRGIARGRRFLIAGASLVLILASGSVAFGAPPGNDDPSGATAVSALPFTDTIDVSEATGDAADPSCVGGEQATVWYSFTPSADVRLEANTFGSDYDTVLVVVAESPFQFVGCSDDTPPSLQSRVRFNAAAGTTYRFMVGAFPGTVGGNLTFNLGVAPPLGPPPEIDLTIDPTGSVAPSTGAAEIHGTVTCSVPVFVGIDAQVRQRAGRVFVQGFGFDGFFCSGETPWTLFVQGENGRFAGGRADAAAFAFGCDPDDQCDDAFASGSVRLRGSRA